MKKRISFLTAVAVFAVIVFSAFILSGCECKHEYVLSSVTAPSCTEDGYTTYVCSKCGDTYNDDIVPALGHDYGAVVTDPTCTEDGYTTHTCSRCDDTYTDSKTAALGHDYDAVVTDPTCTEDGYTTHTCSRCDDSYTDSETTALGHDYKQSVLVEATGLKEGKYRYQCTRCGESYIESYKLSILTSEEIYALASKSVGEVITYDKNSDPLSLGSCFVISEDGKIVTNFHVIDEAYAIEILINGKTYTVTSVLACDETKDLAVLKINATGLSPVKMLKETPVGGWTVYAFGNPEGFAASMTKGIISSPQRTIDGVECIQHDASISSGSSGGPLYNEYGEVLGVNAFDIIGGNNINFAISVKELDNLDYSSPMTMEQFYAAHGPYFTIFIYDYIVDEVEPNYSPALADLRTYGNGTTISGSIDKSNDYDFYKVTIGPGETFTAWMIPEYSVDATGIAVLLTDSSGNILARGAILTINDIASVLMTYTNTSSSTVTLYVVLAYYSDYTYKNTVGNYDLFIYSN